MSLCDGCGGEYGHADWCPEARVRARESRVRQEVVAPFSSELSRLWEANRDLRSALVDVLEARSLEHAKRIARDVLGS